MLPAIAALIVIVLILGGYIAFLQFQLHNVSGQLERRISEQIRGSVSVGLLDRGLNALVSNINKCFKAEEDLRLEAVREEKRFKEMIADISHDLRTPLTAIKGYQQLIEKDSLSEQQRKRLKTAQRHAAELGSLIEHFFEYSCLVNNESKPELHRVNLTNLTAECIADSVPAFEEKRIKAHFDEAGPVFAMADSEMTVRIIQNLLGNCVRHADSDIYISVAAENKAVISIKNEVKNPSEIDAERLFERFYTADRARSRSTGLGLSIVKLLAERMDGCTGASLNGNILEIHVMLPLY